MNRPIMVTATVLTAAVLACGGADSEGGAGDPSINLGSRDAGNARQTQSGSSEAPQGRDASAPPPSGGSDAGADASPVDSGTTINGCATGSYVDRTSTTADRSVDGPDNATPVQYKPPCIKVKTNQIVTFGSTGIIYFDYFSDHPLEPFGGDANNPIKAQTQGGLATFSFPKPGIFGFRCAKHPTEMRGAVWVVP